MEIFMKNKGRYRGEITIETAIVFPIVILMVLSLMYFTMFLHDIVTLKSYAYAMGNKHIKEEFKTFEKNITEEMGHIPLFVIDTETSCSNKLNSYLIKISYSAKSNFLSMNRIINQDRRGYEIKVEKNMSRDILYITSAIKSNVGEGE